MARTKKPIWTRNSQGEITRYEGRKDAAAAMGVPPAYINYMLDHHKSKNGVRIYEHEPTEEEINAQAMPMYERANSICKEQIDNQEFEVDCDDRQVFFLERSREARVNQLYAFIRKNLQPRWEVIPKMQANLEKRFVKEILESLK